MNTTRLTSCFFANITHDTHLIRHFRFALPDRASILPTALWWQFLLDFFMPTTSGHPLMSNPLLCSENKNSLPGVTEFRCS